MITWAYVALCKRRGEYVSAGFIACALTDLMMVACLADGLKGMC